MKKIEIYINQETELIAKYSKNDVSQEIIDYIINKVTPLPKHEAIQIIINNNLEENINCQEILLNSLNKEYEKSVREYNQNNRVQILYLIIGVFIIFLSTLISNSVLKETILISGWVPIWAMVELEIFADIKGRKKRRVLKKIIASEIIEKRK